MQIVWIDNGVVVTTPIKAAKEPQVTSHFCGDYTELCNYLKVFFPAQIISKD